ncbi:RNA-dependent RNA polymerase [Wenling narna-like virus 5]|uniref:RNA-dependent RNA polymerase n=1 Tax=Wenling narna-like virus 5 TaxID=1923505 RepID=UPI00090A3B26|nr:RNA-dependent RNA polymerase [Wenling narna-like virus 5]APG77257.1 RNA-dependent RNA polymerase [Wenling narna-like virus 5]
MEAVTSQASALTHVQLVSSIKYYSTLYMCKMTNTPFDEPAQPRFHSCRLHRHLLRCSFNPSMKQRRMLVSLLMVKKGYGLAPEDMVENSLSEHAAVLGTPGIIADGQISDGILDLVEGLFPVGWDKHGHCGSLQSRAVYEGGVATNHVGSVGLPAFGDACFNYNRFLCMERHYKVKACAVQQPGKIRIITKGEVSLKCLMPLQNSIMAQLRKNKSFCLTNRELEKTDIPKADPKRPFVSGDYKSATDYLCPELQYNIMRVILERSTSEWVKKLWWTALEEVSCHEIEYPNGTSIHQARGQLMGSLLSFPLLCIINYCVLQYLFKGRWCLINGDDILFQANKQEYSLWCETVARVGFQLSLGKNYHTNKLYTINSRFFKYNFLKNTHDEICFLHLGRMFGPMSGDTYRRIPSYYQHMYKRYCKKVPHMRDLLEPVCYGGMGGVTFDEYLKMVPVRRGSSLALHHQLVRLGTPRLAVMAYDVLVSLWFGWLTWSIPTCRRPEHPIGGFPRVKGKLSCLLEPRMKPWAPNVLEFIR